MTPETCPNCGADVPPNAKACPECGSDETTGWSEAATDALDLPEEHFDYEDYVKREFGEKNPVPRGVRWYWWLIGLGLLFVLIGLWLR